MARLPISEEKRRDIIQDWKHGKYPNYFQMSKAHKISAPTVKKIILESKAVHGEESEEFQRLLNNHTDATREYAFNPTDENKKSLEAIRELLPQISLTSLYDIVEESNNLIADEIADAIEKRLLRSNIIKINMRVSKNIADNRKTTIINGGKEDGFLPVQVPLDSGDLKNYVDIADKSLIALGLADRFAPKGDINVSQNQSQGVINYQANLPMDMGDSEEGALEYEHNESA